MGKITIKTNHIGMAVIFEYELIHLSNYLAKVRATCGNLSIASELEAKVEIPMSKGLHNIG